MGLRISLNYLIKKKNLLGSSSGPGSHSPWALSSQMRTRRSSTGLARPAGRPAGRASSRNPPNLDPACDKPASAAPFSGICRGRPTCGTSGRSGGYFGVHFGTSGWEGPERIEKSRESTVLRIKCSIVENVPTPRESLLELFLTSQLPYRAKIKK